VKANRSAVAVQFAAEQAAKLLANRQKRVKGRNGD
jgi:hypothetical protein